jgi:hypothetical protein
MLKEMKHSPLLGSSILNFYFDNLTTRLVYREHFRPLLVQKPVNPEEITDRHSVILLTSGGVRAMRRVWLIPNCSPISSSRIRPPKLK